MSYAKTKKNALYILDKNIFIAAYVDNITINLTVIIRIFSYS